MRRISKLRGWFWAELGSSIVTAVLAIVTLISPEWIEMLFGVDPDGGNGMLEWGIVVALASVTLVLALLARMEWRQAAAHQPD
ncbi:hypothetical protein SAMN05444920_14813 [Nonomuraea solani]|uniref:Uncharacterized protein n=1 Tax=Nonomuraea solani TaxID=1144553 RepID=A0A1H6F3G2_9ACTN|nr:ABC transporter permease [Nonomuraea solani]SEH03921.1 hypothetical protein SAMN05444920_14813 [Nonomuraea solani]